METVSRVVKRDEKPYRSGGFEIRVARLKEATGVGGILPDGLVE